MMRTANPALNSKTFTGLRVTDESNTMTLQGTVHKTGFLLLLVMMGAWWTWRMFFASQNPAVVYPWIMGGAIAGLVVAMVTIFKKDWAGVTAPAYAILEGFVLGGISAIFEVKYHGIVIQAVGLTFGTLFALLIAYRSGMIKVTQNFRLGVVAATGGILMVYVATWLLGMLGLSVPFIHQSGIIGIGFSAFVVVIAALNLVLDFDFIERGAESHAPKFMEWYAAFGLIVTLVWLYLEILRLLAKLNSRR